MPRLRHRQVDLAYSNALPGTCVRCGKPGADKRGRRWHPWCWDRHREESNPRGAAKRREGEHQRCVGCQRLDGEYVTHKGKTVRLKVQRDHIVSLALNGPHDWTAPRCQLCHQDKTNQDNARVKAHRASDPRTARRAKRQPDRRSSMANTRPRAAASRTKPTASAHPIEALVRVVLALAIIGASAITFFDKWGEVSASASAIASASVPYLIAIASPLVVLAATTVFARWRKAAREQAIYRLGNAFAREARVDPTVIRVRARKWSHGVPVRGECWYSETVDDREGSETREKVETLLQRKLGLCLKFDWQEYRDTVYWWPDPDQSARAGERTPEPEGAAAPDADAERAVKVQAIEQRVEDKIRSKIKDGTIKVTWGEVDAEGPKTFRLEYPSSYADESDERRLELVQAVNMKAPGRWRAEWHTEENAVEFVRRPPMPAMVKPPMTPLGNTYVLRYAMDERREHAAWDLKVSSHGLIIGATNAGKTSTLRAIIVSALLEGFAVVIVDPKQTELIGFVGWPGVRVVATATAEMSAVTYLMYEEMDRRYEGVKLGKAREDQYKPVLFVVDEQHEFIERVQEFYDARGIKYKGDPAPVRQLKGMGRLSRKARVHMLGGIQRPDAAIVGGAARDNYRFRVANGPLSKTAAQMFFEAVDVGRDIPEDAKGRATGRTSTGEVGEVQVSYIPDPHEWAYLSEEEKALLTQLRDAAAKAESDALAWMTPEYVAEVAEDMFPEEDDEDSPAPKRRRRAPAAKKPAAIAPPPRHQVVPDADGWLPVKVVELQDGDRARLVIDGEPTAVEIVALVESPDSDDLIEVTYRLPNGAEGDLAVEISERVERYTR